MVDLGHRFDPKISTDFLLLWDTEHVYFKHSFPTVTFLKENILHKKMFVALKLCLNQTHKSSWFSKLKIKNVFLWFLRNWEIIGCPRQNNLWISKQFHSQWSDYYKTYRLIIHLHFAISFLIKNEISKLDCNLKICKNGLCTASDVIIWLSNFIIKLSRHGKMVKTIALNKEYKINFSFIFIYNVPL